MRQRSNTLPKSFGSQLEKEDEKKQELVDKAIKPSVEATLESIQRKLQEKRAETSRPEDIKVWFCEEPEKLLIPKHSSPCGRVAGRALGSQWGGWWVTPFHSSLTLPFHTHRLQRSRWNQLRVLFNYRSFGLHCKWRAGNPVVQVAEWSCFS